MNQKTENFAKEFLALCHKHQVFPVGGYDGEIFIGYDPETQASSYLSWKHGEDEELREAKLRYIKTFTTKTEAGNVTTVAPDFQIIAKES